MGLSLIVSTILPTLYKFHPNFAIFLLTPPFTMSLCINQFNDTGSSIIKRIMYSLISQARKKSIRWDTCQIVPEDGPFWYPVSKKFHNYSVIIHLWRLWRSKTVEICKIYWKLIIFKSHYCFANISAMKALLFILLNWFIHD